jgi:hypothetical protein
MNHVVHGLVTIRLIGATQSIVDWVIQVLGPSQGAPADEPDICVRFTNSVTSRRNLRFLGGRSAAFDGEDFYLLDDCGRCARIEFDRLGERCALLCERGVGVIPLLVPILGLRLLRKGHVLLHCSSFVYDGKGIAVAGWETGGKTEMLLAFMAAGAQYLADEWTIVSAADGQVRGLASHVQIWSWQFDDLPAYWSRISAHDRRHIRLSRLSQRLYQALPGVEHRQGVPARILRHLARGAASAGRATASPHVLFGGHVWSGPARLDRVFLPLVTPGATAVVPVDAQDVARRMVASLAYERRYLLTAYHQFRFAFPGRANPFLETVAEQERDVLARAFAGKQAYHIYHPYPVPLPDLYQAALPWC